ncbi:toxin Cry1Ac domain D-VI-related protein [Listeria booriae]|uniref:toxin Cry1Ac domain D-VI-related protein n=1 Tax=Listeria booriae TaxID=1552123 RepID=UPI001624DFE1|nr:toxin Cry1Ac domain D-VI-related protein [Listeria booriae]MBC2172564.1 LPXTG cell wall anchor domain-containing protein [Listeria booriae]
MKKIINATLATMLLLGTSSFAFADQTFAAESTTQAVAPLLNTSYEGDVTITGHLPAKGAVTSRVFTTSGWMIGHTQTPIQTDENGDYSISITDYTKYVQAGYPDYGTLSPLTQGMYIEVVSLDADGNYLARSLLNVQSADAGKEAAVNKLFIDNNPTNTIRDTLVQADIDQAENIANSVTDATLKATLQDRVASANQQLQDRLLEQEATATTHALFIDANPINDITEDLTQEAIDTASNQVSALKESPTKNTLQANIDKAQQQLTEKLAEQEAAIAVASLFTESHEIVADLTQDRIDQAQLKVNAVTNLEKKAQLQEQINDAQQQLDNSKIKEPESPTPDPIVEPTTPSDEKTDPIPAPTEETTEPVTPIKDEPATPTEQTTEENTPVVQDAPPIKTPSTPNVQQAMQKNAHLMTPNTAYQSQPTTIQTEQTQTAATPSEPTASTEKTLPKTGDQNTVPTTLFGTLLIGLAALWSRKSLKK